MNSVRALTKNVPERSLYGANRIYTAGDSEKIFFSEKRIDIVIIESTSPGSNGSRGVLEVELFSRGRR